MMIYNLLYLYCTESRQSWPELIKSRNKDIGVYVHQINIWSDRSIIRSLFSFQSVCIYIYIFFRDILDWSSYLQVISTVRSSSLRREHVRATSVDEPLLLPCHHEYWRCLVFPVFPTFHYIISHQKLFYTNKLSTFFKLLRN
jgi:hypothetical protein